MKRISLLLAFLATSLAAQDDKILELGQATYQSCVACHGPDGKGMRAGDLLMAPSLHESAFVKGDHAELLTALILKGIHKEDNKYVQAMLALELALNDEQIAALVAYVTKEYGGERRSPAATDIAKWRKKYEGQKSPWKRGDLEEMLKAADAPRLLTDLTYSVYKGNWKNLPDFSKLEPISTGKLDDGLISLDAAGDIEPGFGMVFEGTLTIPEKDEYRFSLTSDDGSALAIDGETIVGNDGIHPAKTQTMKEPLEPGTHSLKVLYFDGGGHRYLSLSIHGKAIGGTTWLSTAQDQKKGKSQDYDPILLTARNPGEAIVHRSFLPDAPPRAIAVGYPGEVNLVWDADTMNLTYLYRGEFMDAASHWNGRGSGSTPLGTDRVKVAPGMSLQVLESLDEPWEPFSKAKIKYERDTAEPQKEIEFFLKHPDYQFRGYSLDGKRFPTFRYDYREMTVTDRFDPMDGGITRAVTFEGKAGENLFYRIADNGSLEETEGWYDLGSMKVEIEGAEPVVRQVGGKKELLAPVTGDSTLTITYRWTN